VDWAIIIARSLLWLGLQPGSGLKIHASKRNGMCLCWSLVIVCWLGVIPVLESTYAWPVGGDRAGGSLSDGGLALTLIYASIRLLRQRVDVVSVLFLVITYLSVPGRTNPWSRVTGLCVLGMFSRGGARGLLIGIALGTLLTGLRVLFGVDRPYGGN
jgi:hypothetical protein